MMKTKMSIVIFFGILIWSSLQAIIHFLVKVQNKIRKEVFEIVANNWIATSEATDLVYLNYLKQISVLISDLQICWICHESDIRSMVLHFFQRKLKTWFNFRYILNYQNWITKHSGGDQIEVWMKKCNFFVTRLYCRMKTIP